MSIEVVVFDADETLWPFRTVLRAALTATLEHLRDLGGHGAAGVSVEDFVADREAIGAEAAPNALVTDLRRAGIARTAARAGVRGQAEVDALAETFFDTRLTAITPFEDTLACLDALADTYRLGILTNGNSHPSYLGLGDRFEFVVSATDLGIGKPDPRVFAHVEQLCGVPADRIVKVGDSLEHDIVGATDAGWHAVWLVRDALAADAAGSYAPRIGSLTELPTALACL